jgi:acid phosphatase (class A)
MGLVTASASSYKTRMAPSHLIRTWLVAALLSAPVSVFADHIYLNASNAPDPLTLLPDPPALGSEEANADAYSAEHVYATRSAPDLALAKDENTLTIFHFSQSLGPWFVKGKFPKTESLFEKIEVEARSATNRGKAHWQRLRPYNAFPQRFPDSIEHNPKTDYSYPSGHSTRGMLFATIFAELVPDKRDAILTQGKQIGWLRVEAGCHFPEDVFAGRILGLSVAHALLQNPQFQHDLAEAKAEIAARRRE